MKENCEDRLCSNQRIGKACFGRFLETKKLYHTLVVGYRIYIYSNICSWRKEISRSILFSECKPQNLKKFAIFDALCLFFTQYALRTNKKIEDFGIRCFLEVVSSLL